MTETATAHRAWNDRWQTTDGRADWLDPDQDVLDTIPLLQERGVRRVLDLGCGVGRHALALAKAGFETFGMDGSESGLEFARQAASESDLAIQFALGAMTDLPYDDASFDYVLAFNVIYHGDPSVVDRAISEVKRILKPGGLFHGTMLSQRNAKYGIGVEIASDTFVISDADDDKSHPHFYCNALGLCQRLVGFELLSLSDRQHAKPGSWHWHLLAEKTA